ncbi:NADH-dependent [FeFe] hydrogenase, group A6 [Haloimpatiens lingqiaonensis]|uniref:NADH-dependent [FeFe] hydrogenase, group A6 n=1 Tax=Haloimpatiens lingqiaonensis TaxID=1380675 RepID=UPI0010FD61BD|nr:NADH-dependent [FeFe] hydrogenase, group A6 [Haloimpatiens lingqiaonensis]
MNMINLTIDGERVEVEKGTSILDAAKKLNINIPTLCHMYMNNGEVRNCKGTCRVCIVEQEGRGKLIPSCSVEATDGMVIKTHSPRVIKTRRTIVELLLSDHPNDCLQCERNGQCELQKIAEDLGIRKNRFQGEISEYPIDDSSNVIVREMDKCILCRRCVTACNEVQKINVLTPVDRGFKSVISTFFNKPLVETNCTYCGQCVAVCPTGALREKRDYDRIWPLLDDKTKHVVVQVAPAVRVALGEEFNIEAGINITAKMVAALKKLGFKGVYDTNFAADMTIMEEATEFIERFTKGENLPLMTSCCPAWVNFVEKEYPENTRFISSCKSPQQIFGAMAKTYLPKKLGVDPKDVVVVSIMPCTAKKYEANREEMGRDGMKDVDIVITTREFSKMLKESGIDLLNLKDADFDNPLGESTGAGSIFGTTGGVMEAALRTAYEWVTGETLENVDVKDVRGLKGIKETTVTLNGKDINIAVASSLGNARKIMDEIKDGKSKYHFVEIMACPGGCINGAGQPYSKCDTEIVKKRMEGIYSVDSHKTIRKSHENPMVKQAYQEFFEKPNSHVAHELLHTK